jgi:hypothetical protein
MVDLVLGIAAAVGASSLYSLGIAFQAVDAKQAPPEQHLRIALARTLIRRRRWLLGTGLSVLGWPLQLVALLLAPLVIVQPTLAAGLLILMLMAERMLGEHAGRNEHLAMGAIVTGVLLSALCAPPRSTHTSQHLVLTLVLVAIGLASVLPYAMRLLSRSNAHLTVAGAGLAYAWSGISTKLASDDLSRGHLLLAAVWALSTIPASALGALSEMSALQLRPAIQVAPVVFVVQTVVPIVFAPLLLGESFAATPLGGIPLSLSLALLMIGATMLARSPLLLALMEGDGASDESGTASSRAEPSHETILSSPRSEPGEPSDSTTSTSPARMGR